MFECNREREDIGSHRHCPSTIEVPNEGNGKEGVGRDVGVSNIVVVMDEGA